MEAIFKALMEYVDEHGVERPVDPDMPRKCNIL